jgi:hypothetical protein
MSREWFRTTCQDVACVLINEYHTIRNLYLVCLLSIRIDSYTGNVGLLNIDNINDVPIYSPYICIEDHYAVTPKGLTKDEHAQMVSGYTL